MNNLTINKYKVLHCMYNADYHDSYVLKKEIINEKELKNRLGFFGWLKHKKKLLCGERVSIDTGTFMYFHKNYDIIQIERFESETSVKTY